jgi:hypothetical protein
MRAIAKASRFIVSLPFICFAYFAVTACANGPVATRKCNSGYNT